jgi:hypothetical protein
MRKATRKPGTIPHSKLMKKIAVDRFADSHETETRCLDLKQKMEHKEKMALMCLKKCKYELWYAMTSNTEPLEPTITAASTGAMKQDKEIQILLLQIKLTEIKHDTAASTFQAHVSSPFYSEGLLTPSGSYSASGPQTFNLTQDFDSGGRMMGSGAPMVSENYGMVEPAGEWKEYEFAG